MKDIKDRNLPESKFDLELITHNSIVNPFNDITRRARKSLLLITFIGFATNWAGFIPTKFEPLGITLTTANQNTISILIVIILIYFISAFWIYANTDLIRFNIIQQAGKDNIRDSLGNELLITNDYLKRSKDSKNKKNDDPPTLIPKLPRPPPEYFKAASIMKLMSQPTSLYKYVNTKVWFDKNIPLILGISCLIFISLKLYKTNYTDLKIILASFLLTLTMFTLINIIQKRKKYKSLIVKKYQGIRQLFTKCNIYFIGYQERKLKKGSWWQNRASSKKNKISKKAMNDVLEKIDNSIENLKKIKNR